MNMNPDLQYIIMENNYLLRQNNIMLKQIVEFINSLKANSNNNDMKEFLMNAIANVITDNKC